MRTTPAPAIDIPAIRSTRLKVSDIQGKNIENMIGSVEIPLGVAGPIKIKNFGKFLVPLATTEGALVASVSRGLKALNYSDIDAVVEYRGMTRAPVFETKSLTAAKSIANSIKSKYISTLKKIASRTSDHIALTKVETQVLGKYLYVRFRFDTDEAMGMNMSTYASESLSSFLEKNFDINEIALSSNFCSDKKIAYSNMILGRGHEVWVDASLTKEVVRRILKTTPEKIQKVYEAKVIYGSILSGSTSFNAQFANIIAAFFAATGQDLGHIGECSQGVLMMNSTKEGLRASVHLPNLNLGTVGGGTSLPTQHEAIDIIIDGKSNPNNTSSSTIAAVLGVSILAGELSLLAALSTKSLARSHKSLTGKRAV